MSVEYAYARIRGRRAKLLTPIETETLIREDLENMENALKDTKYGKYLPKVGEKGGISKLLNAVNLAFIDELEKVKKILSDDGNLLYSLETYLARWDLQNFITIVRGKFYSHPEEEILRALLPIGILDEIRLRDLMKEEDAYSVAERVKVIVKGLPFEITRESLKYLKAGELAKFEYGVYTSFYHNILSRDVHPSVKDFYKFSIDAKNLSLAFISLQYGERPSLWIEGGYLSGSLKIKVLQCETVEDLQRVISEHIGLKGVALENIDTIFERKFFGSVLRDFRRDPVSFYSVLQYLNELEREVITLRTIIYAKSFGLSPEQIKEVLYV
ncbi:MAG: V-type ATPase subunit [candidate division WOR-3 bacterium]